MVVTYIYYIYQQLSETDGYATVERPSDEFPRDRLRFLEPLGNGTFGAVFKAEALSITGTGTWELVAVKLCRGNPLSYFSTGVTKAGVCVILSVGLCI